MNREVHVRFCEEQGAKSPLLTRLAAALLIYRLITGNPPTICFYGLIYSYHTICKVDRALILSLAKQDTRLLAENHIPL